MKRSTPFQKMMMLYAIFALGLVLYFKYFINPVLYFTAQEPIFFFDTQFFKEFVMHPGGLLEYGVALLSQFYFWPWIGALVVILLFVLTFLTLFVFFKNTFKSEHAFIAALPLAFLFYAHHNYEHSLVVNSALLVSLLAVLLYSTLKTEKAKLIFLFIFSPLFYYSAGSALYIFCLYAFIFEILTSRHVVPIIFSILIAVLLPFLANAVLLVRLKDAFYQPACPGSQITTINLLIYLTVPFFTLFLFLLKKLKPALWEKPRLREIVHIIVLLVVFCSIPFLTLKTSNKSFYDIIYRSRIGDWDTILERGENPYPNSPQIVSIINRALAQTGKMGDALFSYPQDFGLSGLFVMDDTHLSTPLIRSDLYFDLGHYNEAKHWAHEAVSVRGETLWNLQRLVVVLLIYDQKEAAAVYLNKLRHTIIARTWAARYMPFVVGEKQLADDPEFAGIFQNKVSRTFLTFINNPVPDLYKLLDANPKNKMASDYLLASLLLQKKVDQVVKIVQAGHGRKLPRHYQEALILYVSQARDKNKNPQVPVEKQVIESFQAFQKSFQANRQNRSAAQRALGAHYGDTFWYYVLFHQGREG